MMQHITIEGIDIAYWANQKDPGARKKNLLFVHGSGGGHEAWSNQLAEFSDGFYLYALELPGHGKSSGEGEDSVFAYARWVEKTILAIKINSPVIIGHSLGAAVCLAVAHQNSSNLSGLVLVGGGAELPVNPDILAGLQTDPQTIIAWATKLSLAKVNREKLSQLVMSQLTRASADVFYKDLLACSRFNLKADLSRITLPTLVICGTDDKMTPPALSHYLRENIPGATLQLIPEAGHFVMWEKPEAFNLALKDFIGSLNAGAVKRI